MKKVIDASWRFDKNLQFTRNPVSDIEFFRRYDLPEMIVREAIQNSLDAKIPDRDKIAVLFSFNEIEKSNVQNYFESLVPHLKAEKIPINGEKVLTEEAIKEISSESLLKIFCIEDHGTTGLDGEISEVGNILTSGNFDVFWRGEGISDKNGEKGGRWGQGKTTYHIASKIKSFWGLTIRYSDKKELLMGKALLSPHTIDNKSYQYGGLFTEQNSAPISDPEYLKIFKQKMKCRRDTPGLSLIIPYPLDEITYESVVKSVIIHYFYPIIKKSLIIKIIDINKKHHDITDSTISEIAESLDWSNTSWQGHNKQYIKELLRFTKECIEMSDKNAIIELPESVATNLAITEEDLQQAYNIEVLTNNFNSGLQIGFRVPINISKKDEGVSKKAFFDIFIKKYVNDEMIGSDEHYIRSGISLPEENKRLGSRPVRGILVAEEKNISEFLGDAEEPAHTNWNERREGFGEKYNQHIRTLRFIRNTMGEIISILDQQTSERDYHLLDHIFYIPEEKEEEKPEDKENESKEDVVQPIIDKEDEFIINQTSNGFSICPKSKIESFPVLAKLKIAYDVPVGNPFSKYEQFDFDLRRGMIKIEIYNGIISKIDPNDIDFELKDRSSRLSLTDFDLNRDIIIRIIKVIN